MKKFTATFVALATAVVVAFTATTFAWFTSKNTVTFPSSFGSAQAAYFAGGDGSKEDPYLIGSPVHLYNLAWLQYLGYFNLNQNGFNNGRAQNFFKLSASINCKGLSVPPIGTEEFPFIGNFDGNGKVVYNVTTSNHGDDLITRPTNAVFSGRTDNVLRLTDKSGDVSIVGLFGVTGDYDSFVDGNYSAVDKFGTLSFPTEEPSTVGDNEFYYSAMKVEGFYVNNLHVVSKTSKTLVGLIAGFVCSTVQNAGVYACDITLSGSARGMDGSTVVSKYSIVGDYDENIVGWSEKPVENTAGGDQGDGASWGGSIDMRMINRRINYMIAKVGTNPSSYSTVAQDDKWGINVFRNSKSEYYWNNSTATSYIVLYLNEGTVLPVNVNATEMGLNSSEEITNSKNGYHYNAYYRDNTSETVSSQNTGYIVGGGSSNNGYIRPRIQPIASGPYKSNEQGVYKSLGYASAQSGSTKYEPTKFEMLTYDVNGNVYRIQDKVNSGITSSALSQYAKKSYDDTILGLASNGTIYETVRENFDQSMDGAYMVHGFHFMNKISETSYETLDYKNATICGQNYTNAYQFIKGGINFTVSDDGIIKTIVGSFYRTSQNSLFDLYKVERNNGKITGVMRVVNIYKRKSDGKIFYNLTGDTSDYTKVFSFSDLTKDVLINAAAYYFEIPVIAGDYVIGADTGSSEHNAYLMYLDIGANGDDGVTESPGVVKKPYNIGMVDFVSNVSGADAGEFSVPTDVNGEAYFPYYKDVTFSIDGLSSSTAKIWYRREDYLATLLPTDESNQISTKVLYRYTNAIIVPTPSAVVQEDETLGV